MIAHSFGRELLERYGSPIYVYDLDEAERQARALFELLPESAQVLYSVKANPIPELCAALKTAGCRVEIASEAELKVVLEAGFAPDQILCSGPGKTASLVRAMLLAGVTHFSCDSWYDLERLSGVALATKKPANALLRLQVSGAPAGSVGVGAMQSHFGADPAELLNGGAARVGALRGAELAGIHIYSGGQIQSADKLAGTFEHAIHLAEQIAAAGIPLRILDLGGGFPWPFGTSDAAIDISALREKLQQCECAAQFNCKCGPLVRVRTVSRSFLRDSAFDGARRKSLEWQQDPHHSRYWNDSLGWNGGLGPDLSSCRYYRAARKNRRRTTRIRRCDGPDGLRAGLRCARHLSSTFESWRPCGYTERRRLRSHRQFGRLCRLGTPCGGVLGESVVAARRLRMGHERI